MCLNLIHFNFLSTLNPVKATLRNYVILCCIWVPPFQWNNAALHYCPVGACTQKHNHSVAHLKIPLIPPRWVGESAGRPLYSPSPALTSTVLPCLQQRYFFSMVMFHLYHHPRMVPWPFSQDMFASVTYLFLEYPLSVWFVESCKRFALAKLAWCPASVLANLDELGHYWIIIL